MSIVEITHPLSLQIAAALRLSLTRWEARGDLPCAEQAEIQTIRSLLAAFDRSQGDIAPAESAWGSGPGSAFGMIEPLVVAQADGDANFYTLVSDRRNWIARIHFNGQMLTSRQEKIAALFAQALNTPPERH